MTWLFVSPYTVRVSVPQDDTKFQPLLYCLIPALQTRDVNFFWRFCSLGQGCQLYVPNDFLVATRRLVSFQSKGHIVLEFNFFLFQASEGLVGLRPPECRSPKMADRRHHRPRHHLLCVAVPCYPISRSQAEDQVSCHQNTEGNFFPAKFFGAKISRQFY